MIFICEHSKLTVLIALAMCEVRHSIFRQDMMWLLNNMAGLYVVVHIHIPYSMKFSSISSLEGYDQNLFHQKFVDLPSLAHMLQSHGLTKVKYVQSLCERICSVLYAKQRKDPQQSLSYTGPSA